MLLKTRKTTIEEEFKKLENVIKNNNSFFILGHLNPDGDSIGSSMAMASMLKRLGKKVYIFSNDKIPQNLSFLHGVSQIKNILPKNKKFDVIMFMECSVPDRGGDVREILKNAKVVVNIDHHKTAKSFGDINILEVSSSSTAEIIYRFFYHIKFKINKREATYLYVGIVTDTGRFHFPATTARTHQAVAGIFEIGINASKINDIIYATKSYKSIKIMGRALESLKIVNENIAIMSLTINDFKEFTASFEHTENVINYGLMINEVKVSVLFKEDKNIISVTFRSKDNIDISVVAKKFGGGGHKNASGCKILGNLEEVKEKVIKEIINFLK